MFTGWERERDSKLNFIANFFPQKLSSPNWMFGEKNFETGLKIGWNKSSFWFSKMSSDDGATIVSALLYLVWIGHVHRNLINKMCGGRLRCIKLKKFHFLMSIAYTAAESAKDFAIQNQTMYFLWLLLSWSSGRFQYKRSTVWIQSLRIFISFQLYWNLHGSFTSSICS